MSKKNLKHNLEWGGHHNELYGLANENVAWNKDALKLMSRGNSDVLPLPILLCGNEARMSDSKGEKNAKY